MSDIAHPENYEPASSSPGELAKTNNSPGCLSKVLAVGGVFISVIFLLNLTAGIVEIPDNLPIIGNLDEVAVTTFMLACLSYLGINIIPRKSKKHD